MELLLDVGNLAEGDGGCGGRRFLFQDFDSSVEDTVEFVSGSLVQYVEGAVPRLGDAEGINAVCLSVVGGCYVENLTAACKRVNDGTVGLFQEYFVEVGTGFCRIKSFR